MNERTATVDLYSAFNTKTPITQSYYSVVSRKYAFEAVNHYVDDKNVKIGLDKNEFQDLDKLYSHRVLVEI